MLSIFVLGLAIFPIQSLAFRPLLFHRHQQDKQGAEDPKRRHDVRFSHEAIGVIAETLGLEARQASSSSGSLEPSITALAMPSDPNVEVLTSVPEPTVLTWVTVSPGATPIAITYQSQLITSYIPYMTICPLDGEPAAATRTPKYLNTSSTATPPSASSSSAQTPTPQTDFVPDIDFRTCTTSYSPTVTPICHTTLTPLAGPLLPVTDCAQSLTFSTSVSALLDQPTASLSRLGPVTAAPSIRMVTTAFLAPWHALTPGAPLPPATVVVQACSAAGGGSGSGSGSGSAADDEDDDDDVVTRCDAWTESWRGVPTTELRVTASDVVSFASEVRGPVSVFVGSWGVGVEAGETEEVRYSGLVEWTGEVAGVSTVRERVGASAEPTSTVTVTDEVVTVTRSVEVNSGASVYAGLASSTSDSESTTTTTTIVPGITLTSTRQSWNITTAA